MSIVLEGKAMADRVSAHNHLTERLELPSYYGRNLDALFDVLTEISQDTEIVLNDPSVVVELMGRYGEALLGTLQEAAEQNPNLTVTLK